MAVIYLMASASFNQNEIYFKVGYTSNLLNRLIPYITHNPTTRLLQTVTVYGKTKRQLETAIHNEIKQLGFEFKIDERSGISTEWFAVDINSQFFNNIRLNGLQVFKNCENRKSVINYDSI
jgi:hypothetical protein